MSAMPDPLPPIQHRTYARWMRLAGMAARLIGMQLHVRGVKANLQQGEIFLFNHFTRIETTIPPFLIFNETGAYARSVTHHSLYQVHPYLRRFLLDTGCVPSDQPNLLPYLAAEILRGRKVVIFPEGGLIKDKQVFDARGNYAVKGADNRAPRPHHRGASVLAVYLDIFRAHIRDANTRGDTATLAHWVAELDLPSIPALLGACAHPTQVVPSTLTFFPIRSESNALVRAIEGVMSLMGLELPERARDELVMETNLILRQTDLDLHIGAALPPAWTPLRAESMLWRHALRNVSTLEQLFALDLDHAQWLHSHLQNRAYGAVDSQRDRAMRALYGGLTVNLHHIMATLVAEYHQSGRNEVPENEFRTAVFWAVHRLQNQAKKNVNLALHASVAEPLVLSQLAQGTDTRYQRFMAMLQQLRLLKRGGGTLRFSNRLDDAVGVHEIRMENPVRLHANEAAPQPAVRLAAMWAVQQAHAAATQPEIQTQWAGAVLQAQRETAQLAHAAAGTAALTAGAAALQPFLLKPGSTDAPANGVGVVVVHGLGATPAQGRPLAEELKALGYTVYGLRLHGHGGQPADLMSQGADDWLAATRLGVALLRAHGLQQVILLGFSTGALVALNVAARDAATVKGVVAVAPALQLVSPLRHLLPVARLLNGLVALTVGHIIPALANGIYPWYPMRPAYPAEQYNKVPLHAVATLVKLARKAKVLGPRSGVPAAFIHGDADTVANLAATQALAAAYGPRAHCVTLSGAGHDILRTNTAHSWAHIIQAVQQLGAAPDKEGKESA